MVKKGIILAAGKGTRLLPLTKALPKEMIRVGLKPTIDHVVEVLKAGGIKEILVIVGINKETIINHLGSGKSYGIKIYYRIQDKPLGTAHAVYQGKEFIGNEDFIVIYGDNYIKPYKEIKKVLLQHKSKNADVTLVLHPVIDPTRYGIVKINKDKRVIGIIEKPSLSEAKLYKTNNEYLNIAGLLILTNSVFKFIEETQIGLNDEIWLTDSIELMRKKEKNVFGYVFRGSRYDIGTFESLLEADRTELSTLGNKNLKEA